MRRIVDCIKRLFREKEEVFVVELDDLRACLSDRKLFCDGCQKPMDNLEQISRVTLNKKIIQVYCTSCTGE